VDSNGAGARRKTKHTWRAPKAGSPVLSPPARVAGRQKTPLRSLSLSPTSTHTPTTFALAPPPTHQHTHTHTQTASLNSSVPLDRTAKQTRVSSFVPRAQARGRASDPLRSQLPTRNHPAQQPARRPNSPSPTTLDAPADSGPRPARGGRARGRSRSWCSSPPLLVPLLVLVVLPPRDRGRARARLALRSPAAPAAGPPLAAVRPAHRLPGHAGECQI
jgi:hypothetical protein